jgi:arylsulfatase A-like enzyme
MFMSRTTTSRRRSLFLAAFLLSGCRGGHEAEPATPLSTAPPPGSAAAAAAHDAASKALRLNIDGEVRPILPRAEKVHEMPLAEADRRGRLNVALGLPSPDDPTSVRLDVTLRADGRDDVLLERLDSDTTGWHELSVGFDASALANPRLVIHRSVLSGDSGRLLRSVTGVPVLTRDAPPPAQPSVILFSLDTLRADRVGTYGDAAARTPVLDALARRGTLFTDAYSPSLWTLPSHAGLFYGAHLPDTPAGLRRQGRAGAALDIPALPLAELLRQHGYATAAFTGGGFLAPPFDFARGFEVFYAFQQLHRRESCPPERFDGPEVFRRATAWLRANSHRPFFLFVHTYDVHDRCPFVPPGSGDFGVWPELGDERQAALQQHYRDLIAEADGRVGALLDVLAAGGTADRTLIVVTSDHGEALSGHGQRGHSCSLRPYEEVARVPLILQGGGRVPAGQRIETPVSLIDVAPSILSLLDITPPAWMAGRPLPGLGLAHPDPPSPVAVLCDRQMALRVGDAKLLAEYGAPAKDELYDLAADPAETDNRAAADPDTLARLRARAASTWIPSQFKPEAQPAPVDAGTLDPAARERLRALGYLE